MLQSVLHELESKKRHVDDIQVQSGVLMAQTATEEDKGRVKDKGKQFFVLSLFVVRHEWYVHAGRGEGREKTDKRPSFIGDCNKIET